MTKPLNPRLAVQVDAVAVAKLSKQYGPVSVDGGVFTFHGAAKPPDSVIAKARDDAIIDHNKSDLMDEVKRRAFDVFGDSDAKADMAMWALAVLQKGDAATQQEKNMLQTITELANWQQSMKDTAATLINDETYRNDGHWPAPPANAKSVIKKFSDPF